MYLYPYLLLLGYNYCASCESRVMSLLERAMKFPGPSIPQGGGLFRFHYLGFTILVLLLRKTWESVCLIIFNLTHKVCMQNFLAVKRIGIFEPTCAHARWVLMCRLLSVCLSVCAKILEKKSLEKNSKVKRVKSKVIRCQGQRSGSAFGFHVLNNEFSWCIYSQGVPTLNPASESKAFLLVVWYKDPSYLKEVHFKMLNLQSGPSCSFDE